MFRLDGNFPYTWYSILLVLSLERSELLLRYFEFPLQEHIGTIQQISRGFVPRFYDIEPRLFEVGKVSAACMTLYNDTFQQLQTALGEDLARLFCEWGNQLLLDTPFEQALLHVWEERLLKLTKPKGKALPVSLHKKAWRIKAIVSLHDAELRAVLPVLDMLDEDVSWDDWDGEAHRIYNRSDRPDTVDSPVVISPLDFLKAMIEFVKIRQVIREIKQLLSQQELQDFLDWLSPIRAYSGNKMPVVEFLNLCG